MTWAVAMVSGLLVAFAAWFARPFRKATLLHGCVSRARHRASIQILELSKALNEISKRKEFVLFLFGNADNLERRRQRDAP